MKNVFLTAALALFCAVGVNAQNILDVTKASNVTDTVYVPESQVIKITKTTAGSNLEYFDEKGDYASLSIRERSFDTANVASSVSITFSGTSGSVDSIEINGVEILSDTVGFTTNISTTVGLVEDSIDNVTQSPVNYAASVSDSTLTITAPAAFGDTANGYVVTVYVRGDVSVTTANPTVMSGGFTAVRNLITLSDRLINLDSGDDGCINADRVGSLIETSTGGTVIWYEGEPTRVLETSDSPLTVLTAINAL